MNVQQIPIDQIFANCGWNLREPSHTTDDVGDLITDIKANGLLHPLTVRTGAPTPNYEPYSLVSGFRRLKALRHLGWENVPAVVLELTDEQAAVVNFAENACRSELNVLQEAQKLERAFPTGQFSQRDVAARLKKHQTWVCDRRMLLRCAPEIQQLFATGRLPISRVREFVKPSPDILDAARQQLDKPAKVKPSVSRRRTRREIDRMIARLFDAGHEGLATRALAWSAGHVSDAEFHADIAAG